MRAEGWYRDPWLVHEDRWFSAGQGTNLVRDGGVEGYDPPPAGPPKAELVEAPQAAANDGDDLRRTEDPPRVPRYMRPGFILSVTSPPSPEPPLDESEDWLEGRGSGRG